MAHLEKHREILLMISKAKPSAAKKLLNAAPSSLVKVIAEIALNALNGIIPLTARKLGKLKKYKNNLRAVANAPSDESRRKVLQRGGFVGALLGAALPLLFKGVSKLVSNIRKKKAKARGRKHGRR